MIFRISFINRCLMSVSLGICIMITACLTPPPSTPPVIPTCISSTPDANPYASHEITQDVHNIYQRTFTDLGNARQDALFQLGQNMQHWSAQVDVINDNSHMVRVSVTYLDPVLIQYIVLNYVINDPNFLSTVISTPINSIDTSINGNSIEYQLNMIMQKLATRNEMLFIVTITSPFYRRQAFNSTDLTMKLPIMDMTLSSASNMQVKPLHVDRILTENMDITQGPVSGIVGYPLALLDQDQCNLVIDQWTNTLTLDIPSVTLGSTTYQQKFWNIPFRSLVLQSDVHPTPTYDPNIFSNSITKLDEPPTPSWLPNSAYDNTTSQVYWELMGRYVWNLVITESHH